MTPPFDQKCIVTEADKRTAITCIVQSLTATAMNNKDKLHICISYKPHVDWISCEISHLCRDYLANKNNAYLLMNKYIRLSEADALNQVRELKSEIEALVRQTA